MIAMSQVVTIERHEWGDSLAALTFAELDGAGPQPRRLVIALHGLGSSKERHLDLCLRLARAGYLACVIDARLHGERRMPESAALWGDRESVTFAAAFADTVEGTLADLSVVADELGAERYAVIGHSMGGLIATLLAAADPRAAVVVNVGGSIDMRVPPGRESIMPPDLYRRVRAIDPIVRARDIAPAALLLVHGTDDATVSVAGARALFQALRPSYDADPDRLALLELAGVGHDFVPEEAEAAIAFVGRYL